MDSIVHFEIPASDMKRAEEFYHHVFKWQIQPIPEMKYTIVRTGEVDDKYMLKKPGIINGGMMHKDHVISSPVLTVQVANIDHALVEIEKAGGQMVKGKWQVGDMGFAAYFKDTEGNVMGLWETVPGKELVARKT